MMGRKVRGGRGSIRGMGHCLEKVEWDRDRKLRGRGGNGEELCVAGAEVRIGVSWVSELGREKEA